MSKGIKTNVRGFSSKPPKINKIKNLLNGVGFTENLDDDSFSLKQVLFEDEFIMISVWSETVCDSEDCDDKFVSVVIQRKVNRFSFYVDEENETELVLLTAFNLSSKTSSEEILEFVRLFKVIVSDEIPGYSNLNVLEKLLFDS